MKNLICCVAIATLLSGCSQGFRSHSIGDPTQDEVITLTKMPEQDGIYSWTLKGSGEIEGEATISVMLNEEPYLTEELSGKVDFQWNGDWYGDEAELVYTSVSATGGNLDLKYRFHN